VTSTFDDLVARLPAGERAVDGRHCYFGVPAVDRHGFAMPADPVGMSFLGGGEQADLVRAFTASPYAAMVEIAEVGNSSHLLGRDFELYGQFTLTAPLRLPTLHTLDVVLDDEVTGPNVPALDRDTVTLRQTGSTRARWPPGRVACLHDYRLTWPNVERMTEEMRHDEPAAAGGNDTAIPSLYEWAGGAEAFERLTETFYAKVTADDLVGPLFAHMDPAHPKFVAMWLAEVFGGPSRYTDERGGYPHMLAHHLGKAITEPQRRRWVNLLADAADEAGLPGDPEFRAAFMGYVEWGTRLAVANSQPGATPPSEAPVPHWGWGVAPPYLG
jgi:truncated hemoglobin YjbI